MRQLLTRNANTIRKTYLRPAKKSRKAPVAKKDEPMIGTIQWMLADDVQPNQNIEIFTYSSAN